MCIRDRCMAAAMMTGCAGGSSGANGKTLTVGLNTGFNGIFSPLYYQTVYDEYNGWASPSNTEK